MGAGFPRKMSLRDPAVMASGIGTLDIGLEAHWLLDEASGTRNDAFGANHLTDNNTVTSGTGVKGNSAFFTAANTEFLSRADNASLSFGNEDMTITFWVKLANVFGSYNVVSKFNTGSQEYLVFYNSGNGFMEFYVSGDGTTLSSPATDVVSILSATWYFVWCEHDATANTLRISVNNGTKTSAAHTTGIFDGTSTFMLGDRQSLSAPLDGELDDPRIYRRILTAGELAALAQNPPP